MILDIGIIIMGLYCIARFIKVSFDRFVPFAVRLVVFGAAIFLVIMILDRLSHIDVIIISYGEKEKMTKNQILKKVRKIESERPYRWRCIDAGICPVCGEPLIEIGSEPHPFITRYKCEGCGNIETK